MENIPVLGNEAVALAAIHAGITAAYGYPGTPSTEALEFILNYSQREGHPKAFWSTNEKTAYETALGVALIGKRSLVTMKHVGLNVAADPFMSSALVDLHGSLVLMITDDPGMHSSQNEQDSRYYADLAKIPCFEPATNQEAYDMTIQAFELSEKLRVPVMVRLVTRLAHCREIVRTQAQRAENPIKKAPNPNSWILMPMNARRQWHSMLEKQKVIHEFGESTPYNKLHLSTNSQEVGVITTGVALGYFNENRASLGFEPSHLHIGAYPFPVDKIRKLAASCKKLYIIEDGYPYLERYLRGILPQTSITILGKISGHLPMEGELNPDHIRQLFNIKPAIGMEPLDFKLSGRPPQLCAGCPHTDSYGSLKKALSHFGPETLVASDVGCYTLGALAPLQAIETCVCMGASIGLAKGAADSGFFPAVAVIGDSTFLHSGISPLLDAVASNSNMTLLILDNETVAMTGGQPTIVSSARIKEIVLGCGVSPEHLHVIEPHRKNDELNAEIIRKEIEYPGLSVIIGVRECIETLKRKKQERRSES